MALLSTATASPRQFYAGTLTATQVTVYTAPSATANVTSPSATAYIKEILICNTSSTAQTITILIGGYYFLSSVLIPANDTKILSLNTYMLAGSIITALAGTTAVIGITISGVEVQ